MAVFLSLPYTVSRMMPPNTREAPTHCMAAMAWLKMKTDARMEKNLRVVVMIEHVSGPYDVIVTKMKC